MPRRNAPVFLFLLLLSLGSSTALAEGVVVDRIVAVVNDDLVLQSQVDERIDVLAARSGGAAPLGEELVETRAAVLEEMIGEQLIEQAIVRLQIEITDDPRITGTLPPEAGPHVPVFEG